MITLVEARSETLDAAKVWMEGNDWMSDAGGAEKTVVRRDSARCAGRVCNVFPTLSQALLRRARPTGAGG